MKRAVSILIMLVLAMALRLPAAVAAGIDLDSMSIEELQKLQEQLNQSISEKQNKAGQDVTPPEAPPVPVTGLKMAAPKDPLASGREIDLAPLVTVTPDNASRDGLEYTISDEKIAVITADGKLTGKKAGTVTVTVKDPASGRKASAAVRVVTLIEDIEADPRYFDLFTGKSYQLKPKFIPEDATNKKMTWESDHPEIAKVAANGTVTGVAPGSAYITGRSQDGSFKVVLYRVTVKRPVKKITLAREKNFFTGEVLRTEFTVEPEDATNRNVTWTSSDPGIAEVSGSGTVSAKKPGKCTITATASDGSGVAAKFTAYVDPLRPMHLDRLNYKTTKAGKIYSFDAVSDCVRRRIKGFNYEMRCYDEGDDIPTILEYYVAGQVEPGKKAATKWSGGATPGFATAERVVVIVTGVFFTDGTSVRIPENSRQEITFHMN